jgi:hypothetical protein
MMLTFEEGLYDTATRRLCAGTVLPWPAAASLLVPPS